MELTADDLVLMIARDDTFCHVGIVGQLHLHRHDDDPHTKTMEYYDRQGRPLIPEFEDDSDTVTGFEVADAPAIEPDILLDRIARTLDAARAELAHHPDLGVDDEGNAVTIPELHDTLSAMMVSLARAMNLADSGDVRHRGNMLHNLMHAAFG